MKNDENLPTESEIEARIVAWVLGEASAFEAAELERRVADDPELAAFKRRIEAVHGLVSEAARPVDSAARLSPERRARLLAAIGPASEGSESATSITTMKSPPRRPWWQFPVWVYPAAACLLAGVFIAHSRLDWGADEAGTSTRFLKREATLPEPVEMEKRKAEEQRAVELADAEAGAERRQKELKKRETAKAAKVEVDAPVPSVAPKIEVPSLATDLLAKSWKGDIGQVQDSTSNITFSARPARPDPSQTPLGEVSSESIGQLQQARTSGVGSILPRQQDGFSSQNLNRSAQNQFYYGVPTQTPLRNEEILATGDGGVTNNSAGVRLPKVNGGKIKDEAIAQQSRNLAINSVGGALAPGGLAASQAGRAARSIANTAGAAASPAENEVVELSPFMVSDDKQGYLAQNSLAGTRRDRTLADGATTTGASRPELGATIAGAKDADRPIAHPGPRVDEGLRTEVATRVQPISTFSLHVGDVSFRLAAAALARGQRPDPTMIRPEEFYNAFDYGDPAPLAGEAVACRIEQAAHPFLSQRNLVRVAMKVPATGRAGGQPLRLTVLLDTSGSMEREDRVATVRRAFEVLAGLLGPADRITLIGFARQPRLLADRVPGDQARRLAELVAHVPAEGGTNLEEALKLARQQARAQFDPSAQNRVVVLTDGAANLGNDNPQRLAEQVSALRQEGIAFDGCGIGAEGLDDSVLEALTRQGDGRYYVVNSPEQADADFAHKLAGAFRPAAENVKVQVRFNPTRVRSYRLIGFEQHRLRAEDFRDDQVDAAELAPEEAAVALYQVELRADGEGELGDVFVRFRNPATKAMVERSWTLTYAPQAPTFDRASAAMQLAGTAAFLAEKMRGGALGTQIKLADFAASVNRVRGEYPRDPRVQEFVTMFNHARRIYGE